jgi:hypothetical protein
LPPLCRVVRANRVRSPWRVHAVGAGAFVCRRSVPIPDF